MISRVKLRNFKCFSQIDVPLSEINLLCGLNGMGKSSLIQALLLLHQSHKAGDLQQGRLLLSGDLADLGRVRDVLFEDAKSDVIEIEVHHSEILDPCKFVFEYSSSTESGQQYDTFSERAIPPDIPLRWQSTPPIGGHLTYISAERLGPRKLYEFSESRRRTYDLGIQGEYAINFLQAVSPHVLDESDPRCPPNSPSRRCGEILDQWLDLITPGAHLEISSIIDADAIKASFSFDRPGDVRSRPLRATNVGFGLSFILPVLAALIGPPRSLCIIENPEAHLHPKGQAKLAELAVQAAQAGIQLIIETHSDHFMNGIRIAVKEGKLKPEKTKFHYFERSDGETKVITPTLDEDGRLSSWPSGFFDQHEENLTQLIAPRT